MTAPPSDPGHEIPRPSDPTLEAMSPQGVLSTLAQASRAAETIEDLAGRVAILTSIARLLHGAGDNSTAADTVSLALAAAR